MTRVSQRQIDVLLDFMKDHPNLANGLQRWSGSSKEHINALWESLADRLNSIQSGTYKDTEKWRRYWADLKHKARMRQSQGLKRKIELGSNESEQEQSIDNDLSMNYQRILSIIDNRPTTNSISLTSLKSESGDAEHKQFIVMANDHQYTSSQEYEIEVAVDNILNNDGSTASYTELVTQNNIPEQQATANAKRQRKSVGTQFRTKLKNNPLYRPSFQSHQTSDILSPGEMEKRRLITETRMADAFAIMAQAARAQAQTARYQLQLTKELADTCKKQTEALVSVLQILTKKEG